MMAAGSLHVPAPRSVRLPSTIFVQSSVMASRIAVMIRLTRAVWFIAMLTDQLAHEQRVGDAAHRDRLALLDDVEDRLFEHQRGLGLAPAHDVTRRAAARRGRGPWPGGSCVHLAT